MDDDSGDEEIKKMTIGNTSSRRSHLVTTNTGKLI